jgi:hypothetical protein
MSIPLQIAAALFSVAEAADVAGVPRKFLDLWVSQKKIQPTRWVSTTRPKSAKSRGRPMFSVRVIFTVRLTRALHSLGLTYLDAAAIANQTEKGKIAESETADFLISTDGDWMTACVKNIHSGSSLHVYAYAAQFNEKWSVDVHLGSSRAAPSFGWQAPHIFVPASDIFFAVYRDCAKLLGTPIAPEHPLKGPLDQFEGLSNFSKPPKRRTLSN